MNIFNILRQFFGERDLKRLWHYWKLLNFKKLLFLPHILHPVEKRLFLLLIFLAVLAGGGLIGRTYVKLTIPVPDTGGSYTEGVLREPRNINPVYAAGDGDRDISRLIFSRLISYSGSGKVELDLAESYEISNDGKIYTVILKKNAFWHDGKPVTGDDVAFTVKMIQNPQYKSPLRTNWQGVEVESLDRHTVRFILRSPYSPFIENLALGILPKHLWENITPDQALLHELNLKPVGSGPFKFSRLQQDKDGSIAQYAVSRNSNYYREGPYLKKIAFTFFKSEEELVSAWLRGRIDGFGPFPAAKIKEVGQEARIMPANMPRIFGIFFNEKKSAPLAELSVRQAIAHALNKKEIAAKVPSSGAIAVDSALPPSSPGFTEELSQYAFDPEQSRTILAKAGWKDDDNDGILEKKIRQNNKNTVVPLRFVLTTSDWPDLLETASAIQAALKEVGIDVVIEKYPFAELESGVIRPRNFEILLFGQVYGYEPDPFAFWHSSQGKDPGLNISLYANKKADQLLEEARRHSDIGERRKHYEEFSRIVARDLPAVFLYSQLYLYALPHGLKGAEISRISLPADRFNEINKWFTETRRAFR